MRKLFARLALVLTIISALSGCVQLPRDGQIQLGPNLENELTTDYLYYSPAGPSDGDTPEQIINGFLNAGTGPQNDYEVAREFLTADFKGTWNPNSRVLIYDGKPQITLTVDESASVSVNETAQVNSLGQYQTLSTGTRETFNFVFKKENGQWRISEAPDVTMIIRPVFDAVFREYSIYFFDNAQRFLVPDVRWFPARASTSTRIVSAMLKGPSDWLTSAVRSPIPPGTKLSLSTVSVSDGIAYVDLSAKALSASRSELQLATVQLNETLLQLDGVYSVRVSIERTPVEVIPISNALVTPLNFSPVTLVDGELVHADLNNATAIPAATDLIAKHKVTDFALSADEKRIALATGSGTYLAELGTGVSTELVSKAKNYLAPIIDRQGYTWLVPRNPKQAVEVFDEFGKKVNFDSSWLANQARVSFSLSSEGGRVVAVTGQPGSTRVRYGAVVRDQAGAPKFISIPTEIATSADAIDASWIDATQIGILEGQNQNYAIPLVAKIGGSIRQLPSVQNAVKIIGSGLESSIFALDRFGTLLQYRGTNWAVVRANVDAIHFSGS